MVTFCLGNIAAKRNHFRGVGGLGTISLDNDEVVADFLLNGKVYFVIGQIPCANMRVWEYLAYARALKTKKPLAQKGMRELTKKAAFALPLTTHLKALSRVQYRQLQLAAKIDEDTKTLYVNFDGLPYSAKNKNEIKRIIKKWSSRWDVFISFSDFRFVPKCAQCSVFSADGSMSGMVRQRVRRTTVASLKKALTRRNLTFKWKGIKQVVISDN